ncbi:unnamed protein product, partial [marine sediment metagenome]
YDDVTKYYDGVADGSPVHYVIDGDNIDIYPLPDEVLTMTFLHYIYLVDLAAATDTNEITNNCPDLLINGALSDLFGMYTMVDKVKYHEALYNKYLADLNARDISRRLPKDMNLSPRRDVYGNSLSRSYPKVLEDYN